MAKAVRSEMLPASNPMQDPQDFITPGEGRRMYEIGVLDGRERDGLLALTLSWTWRRVVEIVGCPEKVSKIDGSVLDPIPGLRPRDIDAVRNTITYSIAKKKLKRPRVSIAEHPELIKLLLEYVERYKIQPNERIFPISTSRVRQLIPRLAKLAGIEQLGDKGPHAHAFRHGGALEVSIDEKATPEDLLAIKEKLQHSSIAITERYLRVRQVAMRRMMERSYAKTEEESQPTLQSQGSTSS